MCFVVSFLNNAVFYSGAEGNVKEDTKLFYPSDCLGCKFAEPHLSGDLKSV